MVTLLGNSCEGLAEGSTTITTARGMSSSSPGSAKNSDGLSVKRYDTIQCLDQGRRWVTSSDP